MFGSKNSHKSNKQKLKDAEYEIGRLRYFVKWRDAYIEQLREQVSSHEEADRLYTAFIGYLITRFAESGESSASLSIPKSAMKESIEKFGFHLTNDTENECYKIEVESLPEKAGINQ